MSAAPVLKPADQISSFHIQGPRVALRPLTMSDAERVYTHMNDFDVVKNLSRAPWPYGLTEAAQWLRGLEAAANQRTDYPFAIVTGDGLIGVVGISAGHGDIELGYWLGRPAWGKGYATEAARLALGFAFDELELNEITAGHFADNAASGRVLQKLGFDYTSDVARFSNARACDVLCRMMILPRERFQRLKTADEGGMSHGG